MSDCVKRKAIKDSGFMNILILSAGTRDKVVEYFKREINGKGKIVATDCSNLAPAIYEADKFYLVNRISDEGYIDGILDICLKEQIDGVFSLIDPELSLLAKEGDRFKEIGCTPIVSDYDLVEKCFNKYEMAKVFRNNGLDTAKCYLDVDEFKKAMEAGEISYPVFVKPVCGSASLHINMVNSDEELMGLFHMYDDLMIQEYMGGQEYGADVYIDMISGKCTDIFVKKKIKMRAGETDKSVSFRDQILFDKIKSFVEEEGFRGMIDIDIFDIDGKYYFSEVNPRFGGGYPHAYECGVNMPKAVINNLEGKENSVRIGDYKTGICMMKYNEVMIKDMNGTELVP